MHSSHHVIRQRMHYLILRAQGLGPGQCAKILSIHPNTATHWAKCYLAEGLAGLLHYAPYRPHSALHAHRHELAAAFTREPPRSIVQAAQVIEQRTAIRRGLTQTRRFVKQTLGMKCRRFRCLPGGKLPIEELAAQQRAFLLNTLQPLLEQSATEAIDLYFVDAAHPVQGFHAGRVWSPRPLAVRTPSGRHRLNILAALDSHRQELYSITTPDYIQATTVVELLDLLRQERPGRPIHLVLDNARYQRCALVQQAAQRLDIHLVYLPPYSPNLNLIERFWKFLKKQALAGYHFATKQDFEDAIYWFIEEVNNGEHQAQLRTLLALNFQQLVKPPAEFSHKMAA
ncbi:IS630 family transposase [Neolewinella sp.]|uniref:IS630 family transposase n=1 Tax=Neolewinella sp. TaxID=2993543 RepID=UPI003B51A2BA